jgi:hypothetical protein
MLSLITGKFKLYAIGITLLLVISAATFLYYRHVGLVEENAKLEEKVEAQELLIAKKDAQIDLIKKQAEQQQNLVSKLIKKEREYIKRQRMLEYRLTKDGRDIGVLARKKPYLVEKIINNASDARMRCFEIASGSPVTEDDINAKNTVCPHIISPDS